MALAGRIEALPGVTRAWLAMATEGSLATLRENCFATGLPSSPAPMDAVVAVAADTDAAATAAVAAGLAMLSEKPAAVAGAAAAPPPTSIYAAVRAGIVAQVAIISVPGAYAAAEARKALDCGLHAFLFSDNVSLEAEASLKAHAASKGLLCMGPDCGTAVLDGVPLGFANAVRAGPVGLVGASGTGLQEVACLLHRLGTGVTQVVGCGGRDLKDAVGGTTALAGLALLASDPSTAVLLLVSKPPSPTVAAKLLAAAAAAKKPTVVCFLGHPPPASPPPGLFFAATLTHAARVAAALALGLPPPSPLPPPPATAPPAPGGALLGLYTGGTLKSEAALLCASIPGSVFVDLGDDEYTQGAPHPMAEPATRGRAMSSLVGPEVTTLLFDCVLGAGTPADAGQQLAAQLASLAARRAASGARRLRLVGSVTGLESEGRRAVVAALEEAGAEVADSNAAAAEAAASGAPPVPIPGLDGSTAEAASNGAAHDGAAAPPSSAAASAAAAAAPFARTPLFPGGVRALTIGARALTSGLEAAGLSTHVEWAPPCGGDVSLCEKLARRLGDAATVAANDSVLAALRSASPVLVTVASPASSVIPFLTPTPASPHPLMHAGPPVAWADMCGPQRGAVVAAALLEGWAADEAGAYALAESGGLTLSTCHAHGCVGPMAGVVSPSSALWVVQDGADETKRAFAPLNEGLGRAQRFGAFDAPVLDRLKLLNGRVAVALRDALATTGPLPLLPLMAKALHSGDELHNRCAAATSLLARALAPALVALASLGAQDEAGKGGERAANALAAATALRDNDHAFLNVSMAAAKLACDAACGAPRSTLVSAMARNGTLFGVRLACGAASPWHTAPAPFVSGLFFPQFTASDAGRDMGDSAITETFGLGGFSLAAAPAIAAFVGGSVGDTLAASRSMYGICHGEHAAFSLPALDFRSAPLGIDVLRVLDSGVLPVINTGIAHKNAGVGQIGAGVTTAPLECFIKALAAMDD